MGNRLKNIELAKLPKKIIALLGVAAMTLTGCSKTAEAEKYGVIPHANALSVCDGAKIRDDPWVWTPDKNGGEIKDTIDFGNAPEGTCVTVPASEVYWSEDPDGSWFGVTEGTIANGLTDSSIKGGPNIVWINEQRSSPELTQDQNSTDANQPK